MKAVKMKMQYKKKRKNYLHLHLNHRLKQGIALTHMTMKKMKMIAMKRVEASKAITWLTNQ